MILLLEDDRDRLRRFRRVLRKEAPDEVVRVWRDVGRMVAEIEPLLAGARLISLDHDLEPDPKEPDRDPGEGLEVAKRLAGLSPAAPVIVHSSNRERSDWMIGEQEIGGWDVHRVAPLGDDWIEVDWRWTVRDLLAAHGD